MVWLRGGNSGEVAKSLKFIDIFLVRIALERDLFLESNRPLSHGAHEGICQCARSAPGFVLGVVVSPKKRDLDRGRARAIVQLVAVAEENAKRGFVPNAYLGVITTAERWVCVGLLVGHLFLR